MARLELIGIPGSGKTSLAVALQGAGWHALFEDYRGNPFWAEALAGQTDWLGADLVFLIQHRDLVLSAERIHAPVVCDFSFVTDLLYAKRRQRGEAASIYSALHKLVASSVSSPPKYVYLDASPETVARNIKSRGRAEEQALSHEFFAELVQDLRATVATLEHSVIRVDVDSCPDVSRLLGETLRAIGRIKP